MLELEWSDAQVERILSDGGKIHAERALFGPSGNPFKGGRYELAPVPASLDGDWLRGQLAQVFVDRSPNPERAQDIMWRRSLGQTFQEAGEPYGISRARASQIYMRALRRMFLETRLKAGR